MKEELFFTEEFVRKLCNKDEDAFIKFYNSYVEHFFRYIRHMYPIPKFEVQDIVSDVFIKIWNNLDTLQDISGIKSRAWTICRNTTIDAIKRKKLITFSELSNSSGIEKNEIEFDPADTTQAVSERINNEIHFQKIAAIMHNISIEDKDILYFHYAL